jgi:Uma2 family endonuclease
MATISTPKVREKPFYIESDGKPMGETQAHIENMLYLLDPLKEWFSSDPMVYVGGNMFVHYERGNRNRHLSPDVFVVRGVPKDVKPKRRAYRVWEEGKAPDVVIELTSESTRREDQTTKRAVYQDVLHVKEYFLFDPFEEYLHPPFQGYRLVGGNYRPIKPIRGRLPSKVLGLHLEAVGELLRLYDPSTSRWLETPPEVEEARKQAEAGRAAEAKARQQAEAEAERLRREIEELRRRLSGNA